MDKTELYKKISLVMKDVEYLAKDGRIDFGKTRYRVITEEKVTSMVRESLIKNKLIIIPVEQKHRMEIMESDARSKPMLTTVDVKYKIIDVETGQSETIVSSGTGVDTQDKGVGKAMTYAYKYMMLRTFAIPTGEDPDKVSSAELDAKQEIEQRQVISQAEVKIMEGLLAKLDKEYKKKILSFNKVEKLEGLTKDQYGKAMLSIKKLLEKE